MQSGSSAAIRRCGILAGIYVVDSRSVASVQAVNYIPDEKKFSHSLHGRWRTFIPDQILLIGANDKLCLLKAANALSEKNRDLRFAVEGGDFDPACARITFKSALSSDFFLDVGPAVEHEQGFWTRGATVVAGASAKIECTAEIWEAAR